MPIRTNFPAPIHSGFHLPAPRSTFAKGLTQLSCKHGPEIGANKPPQPDRTPVTRYLNQGVPADGLHTHPASNKFTPVNPPCGLHFHHQSALMETDSFSIGGVPRGRKKRCAKRQQLHCSKRQYQHSALKPEKRCHNQRQRAQPRKHPRQLGWRHRTVAAQGPMPSGIRHRGQLEPIALLTQHPPPQKGRA